MEVNRWPPELVIPEYILQPILHTVYTMKSLEYVDYMYEDGDSFIYKAFKIQKPRAEAIGFEKALDMLIETCKDEKGRFTLGKIKILPVVVNLAKFLMSEKLSTHYPLYLSLKLIRNLCAGEILNQDLFIEVDGVDVVARAIDSVKGKKNYGLEVARTGLELLGNFCRAGEEHKNAVWSRLFPGALKNLAKIGDRDVVNILCMVVYACCDGSYDIMRQLHGVHGVQLVAEIVGTSMRSPGNYEEWLVELVDKICLKGSYFDPLLKELRMQFDVSIDNVVNSFKRLADLKDGDIKFAHIFLFNLLNVRLSKKHSEPNVSREFALSILGLFKSEGVDFFSIAISGITSLDVRLRHECLSAIRLLKHLINILNSFYLHDWKVTSPPGTSSSTAEDSVFELLVSSGLVDHLLYFLDQLRPPSEVWPYLGFKDEIVALIGTCLAGRKHVQDAIRQKDAILLLLQQCDEDNPSLRRFGLVTVAHLLDGNRDNQQALIELRKNPNVFVPRLTGPGFGLKIDRETGRATFIDRPAS
ncbi:hypothetical protein MKW94_017329 [Papaver nudicaule]|uniref:Ataxin-10 domain-containing protein n=1 Tax=Papaver nudicaule TaxID=74823 RepID=A0AA41RPA3_PAPNU|nr:hypothetical protein [Papaver nudicaule]